jgi:hypothetical protein
MLPPPRGMPSRNISAKFRDQDMPLCLDRGDGTSVVLAPAPVSASANEVLLSVEGSSTTVRFVSPLNLPIGILVADYEIIVLKNQFLVENSIFQVYEDAANTRIGWLFPIQALTSVDHSAAENEHFLRYASAALQSILSPAENISSANAEILQRGTMRLSDFYGEDFAVLALSRVATGGLVGFDLSHYRHSLFRFGYVSQGSAGHGAGSASKTETLFRSLTVRINLISISSNLRGDPFLSPLFEGHIDLRGHPLATFLILYQVFELLIERVFQVERNNLLARVAAIGNTVADAKETVRCFREAISEENRLGMLASAQHLVSQPDWAGLRDCCNRFLNEFCIPPVNHLHGYLYPVRNRVVHEFRSVTPSALNILSEINLELLVFLPELVSCYKD